MNHKFSFPRLTIIVGLSSLVYLLVFTLRFPLMRLYATIPPVDYAQLTGRSLFGVVIYVGGMLLLFGLYGWAFRLTRPSARDGQRTPPGGRSLLIGSAVLAAVSIPSYPVMAIDMFSYAIHTRGWALYGLNPLATAPAALPASDPWIGLAAEWMDAPSPYGPIWEWLSLAAFRLSGGTFLAHLLALKLLTALAYLGCVWLIYQIMRRLRPEWAAAATIAFAWNPLVLLESVQNGHNDIIMVFFLLAALWALTRPANAAAPPSSALVRVALASVLFALSISTKYITVLIIPFFWLALSALQPDWRRRASAVGLSAFLIGVTVILLMLPLWPGWENWAVLTTGEQVGRSLLALMVLGLNDLVGLSWAFALSRYIVLCIFVLIYLYYFWVSLRQVKNAPAYMAVCLPAFYTLFWFVLLTSPIFHAWYLLWFVPLMALLLPARRPWRVNLVFSLTALLIIPYFETVRVWYPALLDNHFLGHVIGIPLLIAPPLVATFWPVGQESDFADRA